MAGLNLQSMVRDGWRMWLLIHCKWNWLSNGNRSESPVTISQRSLPLNFASMETEQTYWPSAMVTQRGQTQRWASMFCESHKLFTADTRAIWSLYILIKRTDQCCTALSHPLSLSLLPFKSSSITPLTLYPQYVEYRTIFVFKLSPWQALFLPRRSPCSSTYLTCPYWSIFVPPCDSEKCISWV